VSDSDREHLHRAEQASLSARADPTADLPSVLGKNLKRQRTRRGYSLERLAALSGVSRAMIGQIESGKSSPTISLLLKLATALGVELDHLLTRQDARAITLLRREQSHVLTLSEGKFASRALFRREYDGNVEFYELTIAPQHREEFKAELPGARENLIVASGALTVVVGAAPPLELECGDAVAFAADVARLRQPWRTGGCPLSREELRGTGDRLSGVGLGANEAAREHRSDQHSGHERKRSLG
jgi:transcriptional regulator with XRE-family HTH domain